MPAHTISTSITVFENTQCCGGLPHHFCELGVAALRSAHIFETKFMSHRLCPSKPAKRCPSGRSEVYHHTYARAQTYLVSSAVRSICGNCLFSVGLWFAACGAGDPGYRLTRNLHTGQILQRSTEQLVPFNGGGSTQELGVHEGTFFRHLSSLCARWLPTPRIIARRISIPRQCQSSAQVA